MQPSNREPVRRGNAGLIAGMGCILITLLIVAAVAILFLVLPDQLSQRINGDAAPSPVILEAGAEGEASPQVVVPTFTPANSSAGLLPAVQTDAADLPGNIETTSLSQLYHQVNPGVVNIQVFTSPALGGQGAGSGFILDDAGHIVTNNHVIENAEIVTIIFYDGTEAAATIVGTDRDSDLAVVRVDALAEGAHPLPLGDSDQVEVGEWVIAIGNPFGLGSSMTAGIISALGRTIPSTRVTATGGPPFSIPQAIQTDAAINPGNSGGPLLNLNGEVIGVNAQIATGGTPANAGVGFAIPANVVRRVVPVLSQGGRYQWPWLGVQGGDVNLLVMQANNLETQRGAYIDTVVPNGPADRAGLQGSDGSRRVSGVAVPTGGDVIVEVDGRPVLNFTDLLVEVAFREPGEQLSLTILRDGEHLELTVTLAPRPAGALP